MRRKRPPGIPSPDVVSATAVASPRRPRPGRCLSFLSRRPGVLFRKTSCNPAVAPRAVAVTVRNVAVHAGRAAVRPRSVEVRSCNVEGRPHTGPGASGAWVFKGTRTPAAIVFENLEDGMTTDEVIEQDRFSRRRCRIPLQRGCATSYLLPSIEALDLRLLTYIEQQRIKLTYGHE